MGPKVVITYPAFGDIEVEKKILRQIDAEVIHTGSLSTVEAQAAVRDADALMVTIQPVTADLIGAMQHCRIISRVGTGLDAIDIPAATQAGIWVTYVPDYSIDEVSTHAISLLLAQARGLFPLVQSTRQGIWDSSRSGIVQRLTDQTLGVIGFGRIGQAAAAKGKGLGLRVIAHDQYVSDQAFAAAGVERVDLDTLLQTSDYITLHLPLTEETHHLINSRALGLMKQSAFLVNTARGPLIDEEALLQAVRSGRIAGAALDVLTVEPAPPDHPFLQEERILVTPHAGWYSEAARMDVRIRGSDEVVRVLKGEPPRAPVNRIETIHP
jgi:D-3-phosphoglycerate dehydrogenase / 2-oxoglutarate reductase